MPTVKTVTLGCKVNQYETELFRQGLARLGYREAADGEPADLCVVNTCTVTAHSDAKSRKAIRHLARHNPRAEIIVMGCYATRAAEEVTGLPGVVEVVTDKRQLPELLGRLGLLDVPNGISTFGRRHRAYVKVQDGCRMRCSYCIIPTVRPVLVSRPVGDVLDEIRRLADHGHREIVLTGIHLGHYGVDLDGPRVDLATLVRRIVEQPGQLRARISSLEAAEVTPELLAVMADHDQRVCPHLHLSMQSGSDAVLRRMQRRWPVGRFLQQCHEVRRSLDRPALTTDVIVGFPGETDADFAATCRVVEEVGFSKIHIFRFSPRQGTPAADMPGQIPERTKLARAAELAEIGGRLRLDYFRGLAGRPLQVLVEAMSDDRPGALLGTSERYAPVVLAGGKELLGQLVSTTAGPVLGGRIQATGPVHLADGSAHVAAGSTRVSDGSVQQPGACS
ncbi:MAG: tRNA (N(6)-L-threonylcarbamoyladenosine(37)-C(2))-methylthiotransferase MtaB [Pirellulales bacterium]|nr:tRNA (N(6)-L-threonylcarbamoyladenosine(37)-C(2))-methylthiotransferase MtaB [Pirellulales bacterium]